MAGDTWRELLAQLAAERWRAVFLAVFTTLLVAVVATELTQFRRALDADAALQAAGRDVYMAGAVGEGPGLDAGRCAALGAVSAVVVAGGTVERGTTRLAKAPGEPFVVRGLSGGMPSALTGRRTILGPGVAFLAGDAGRLGIADATRMRLGDARGPVAVTVLDISARVREPGAWVLEAVPPGGTIAECWVEFTPGAGPAADVSAAWLRTSSQPIVVTSLLEDDRLRQSPGAQYLARPTRLAWLAAGAVLGLGYAVVLWFRRAEVALYRTVGMSRPATALVHAALRIRPGPRHPRRERIRHHRRDPRPYPHSRGCYGRGATGGRGRAHGLGHHAHRGARPQPRTNQRIHPRPAMSPRPPHTR